MFVFTREGKASVQVMYRNAQTGSAYAQGGYEASYGSYHIDDSSTFTFHIEGATRANAHRQRPEAGVRDFWQSLNGEIYRPTRTLESRLGTLLDKAEIRTNEKAKAWKKQS